MNKKRLIVQLALMGLMTLSTLTIVSCKKTPSDFVACMDVSTSNVAINMSKGTCEKLAGAIPVPLKCGTWTEESNNYVCKDSGSQLSVPIYPQADYVRCYGIAAANMNDCGTATTACGGSVHVDRQKDAWIAIPNGICKQLKGSTSQLNTSTKAK